MKEQLYLGVARTDITPPVGGHLYGYLDNIFSDSVHDSLTANAFVLRCADVQAVMVSVTICAVRTELADRIRMKIADMLNIPAENCLLCATHTHSGPNAVGLSGWGDIDREYCEKILVPGILKAVREASQNMQHVKMGIATGKSFVGINRRELSAENTVGLGQNEWGPFDPSMTVLSFCDENGKIVANMIHYGAHQTAAGLNTEITRDWSGIMTDRLETLTGGLTAFFNGPEGDVGPRLLNGQTTGNIHLVEELGGLAAMDAVRIYKEIKVWREVTLSCQERMLKIPLKIRISEEAAKKALEEFAKDTVNLDGAKKNYFERVLASYENGYIEKTYQETPQSIIRIGDAAFISFPYEMFSEIGMRIRTYSKVPYALSLSNTNGYGGYFATEDQLCRGGYEVEMHNTAGVQPYAANADWYLVTETLKNLEGIICTE